jgi:threonine dehydrogenase-like Zn-dependent dehydrogenase
VWHPVLGAIRVRDWRRGSFGERAIADGAPVATTEAASDDLIPSLLVTSDVLVTGWYAADAARVQPGSTVVVVGDGAVGLMDVLSAKQMGVGLIAMSRYKTRQDLPLESARTTSSPSGATPAWPASRR